MSQSQHPNQIFGDAALAMGQTAPPTSSPSTSYDTKRRDQRLELVDKVEDEVDRQLVKYILMYDTEELTVQQVAVRE